MMLASGCVTLSQGADAVLCEELQDEADRATEALLRPHTPDDVVLDVEPFVTGYRAGCAA